MNKIAIWLIVAASLVVLGGLAFTAVMSAKDWEFPQLSTAKYVTNIHEITEDFRDICIDVDTADVVFTPSDNGKCRVECYEREKETHSVFVSADTLSIRANDKRSWKNFFGWHFGTPKITVYLPETEYGAVDIDGDTGGVQIPKNFHFDLADISLDTGSCDFFADATGEVSVETDTGSIRVESTSAGALTLSVCTGKTTVSDVVCTGDADLEVSTGRTELKNFSCKNLTSRGDTGHITLHNVVASEKISVERSTGDVSFEGSDAAEIFVQTDTGDVGGSLLTEKIFFVQTDTGKIDVPKSVSGGMCEITTDTGDVVFTIR